MSGSLNRNPVTSIEERASQEHVDARLIDFIIEGSGVQQAQSDLMPVLTERLGQPPNGVLNALRRGAQAKTDRLCYAVESSHNPGDSRWRVTMVGFAVLIDEQQSAA